MGVYVYLNSCNGLGRNGEILILFRIYPVGWPSINNLVCTEYLSQFFKNKASTMGFIPLEFYLFSPNWIQPPWAIVFYSISISILSQLDSILNLSSIII